MAIGTQATLTNRTGAIVGATRTGLLINFLGGVMAGAILLAVILFGPGEGRITRDAILLAGVAGALGIFIITGVAFSLSRTGVAAGVAGMFLGQMLVAVIVDTTGLSGMESVPLDLWRIAGLFITGIGVYMLLPRG